MKHLALILIGLALFNADTLLAQTTTDTKKPNDPTSLSWRKNRKLAKKLIKKGNNDAAVPYLEAGAAKKPKKAYFPENLARIDFLLRDYKSSNKWYGTLVAKDSAKHKKPSYIFEYALTEKYMGQYEDAMANFAKFRKLAGESDESMDMKKRATREMQGCQKGIYYRDSVPVKSFKIKHLDANINQPLADFSPVLKSSTSLYYGSMKDAQSPTHIFKSMKQGREWSKGEEISENINVPNINTGNPSFTQDGNNVYYTQCTTDPATNKEKCKIYVSQLSNGVWQTGKSVGDQVNDPLYTNTQPAVGKNKDGEDVVYFISDRNPGKGLDIFYAKINTDGSLAKPHSAGSQVNSKGDEMSPYFDFKSKTLYFSSNGWMNIGGFDVFKATWDQNGEWLEPENMGTPINSSVDDYYFSLNELGTLGFVVSNRIGGMGTKSETCCDDIYQVETTRIYVAVKGTVMEETDSNRTIADNGVVQLYDERAGMEIGSYHLINGNYFFDLEPAHGYKLITRKDGFYDGLLPFNTDNNTESDTMKYDLFLKKKKVDETNPLFGRVIGRVYYDYDQSKLRDDSRDTLRKVMDILNQYPNIVLEVGAHTDGKGSEDYNVALSKRRADAVMNYYIYHKKVAKDRLVPKAYGTSLPAASNTTPDGKDNPQGRALNRRTEFKIISELKPADKPKEEPKKEVVKKGSEKKTGETPKDNKKENTTLTIAEKPAKATKEKPKANESTPTKVVKKEVPPMTESTKPAKSATEQPVVAANRPEKKELRKVEEDGYKAAPAKDIVIKGMVYVEKGGKRLLVNDGAVFLTSDENGFQQKIFYVKNNGSYMFDLSRATAKSFKLVARKDKAESNEVIFTVDDIKADNKPIDLVIKAK